MLNWFSLRDWAAASSGEVSRMVPLLGRVNGPPFQTRAAEKILITQTEEPRGCSPQAPTGRFVPRSARPSAREALAVRLRGLAFDGSPEVPPELVDSLPDRRNPQNF